MQVQALHRQLILLVGKHLFGRNDPGLDDALVVIEIGQKHVQRLDALNAATLDNPPLAGRNAARNGVERNKPLGPLFIAIQRERNARAVKQQIGFAPALSQKLGRRVTQPAGKLPIVRANYTASVVHLVIKGADHAVLLVTMDTKTIAKPVPPT
ncbi:hypothetical protein ALP75_202816 [Pseudomonas syringae pv. actinidiae]|nr:hypothetical protein ALP75_202816 [Pseudomonas syringae pv. actinidiae]